VKTNVVWIIEITRTQNFVKISERDNLVVVFPLFTGQLPETLFAKKVGHNEHRN